MTTMYRIVSLIAVVVLTGCAQPKRKQAEPIPEGPPGDVQIPFYAQPGEKDLSNIHQPYNKRQWESVVQKWNNYLDEDRADATWLCEYRIGYAADQAYRKTSEAVYLKIARQRYEEAAKKCPTFAPYYLMRAGWMCNEAKERETAQRYFDSVLRVEPDNLSATLWSGWMSYLIKPGTAHSIDLLGQWLKRAPPKDSQRKRVAFALAQCLAIRKDFDAAEKVIDCERKLAPKSSGYLYDLELAEIFSRHKQQSRALQLARKVLADLDPNLPEKQRKPILERIRKINAAQTSAQPEPLADPSAGMATSSTPPVETTIQTPASAPAAPVDAEKQQQINELVEKARVFMEQDNYDAALPEIRRAYELSQREDIIGRLAICLALTGKTDEALRVLDDGLKRFPGNEVMIKMKKDIENRRENN